MIETMMAARQATKASGSMAKTGPVFLKIPTIYIYTSICVCDELMIVERCSNFCVSMFAELCAMNDADWALLCGVGSTNFTIWSNGDFGPCFESVVFGCLPNFVLIIASVYHCSRHQHRRIRGLCFLA